MRAAWTVMKEQLDHFYLIRRLSLYELKSEHRHHYLGILWELINPMMLSRCSPSWRRLSSFWN